MGSSNLAVAVAENVSIKLKWRLIYIRILCEYLFAHKLIAYILYTVQHILLMLTYFRCHWTMWNGCQDHWPRHSMPALCRYKWFDRCHVILIPSIFVLPRHFGAAGSSNRQTHSTPMYFIADVWSEEPFKRAQMNENVTKHKYEKAKWILCLSVAV